MPALLEAEEIVLSSPEIARKPHDYSHLKPYQFKPGQRVQGCGRPKGAKNADTIYLESLPRKAKQWVKSTAPAVLIDARKIALPIESDQPAGVGESAVIIWLEQRLSTLQMPTTVAVQPVQLTHSSTLTPSASTENKSI
mgnify:FL=1